VGGEVRVLLAVALQ
jgi:hypothetical protein